MTPQFTEGQDPQLDESIWKTTFRRIGGFFISLANEFGVAIEFVNRDDNGQAQASYEKTVHIVVAVNEASSDYNNAITKDLCARDHRGMIRKTKTGRVWGGFDYVEVEDGADGFAIANEVSVTNNGSAQPNVDTPTSKIAHSYTGGGKFPATCASYIGGNGSNELPTHFHGHIVRQNAIAPGGKVWDLRRQDSNDSIFCVDRDGNMTFFGRQVAFDTVVLKNGTEATALILK